MDESPQVSKRTVMFVGIAGASGSGKSTVARSLKAKYASPFVPIQVDWFFRPDTMPVGWNGLKNWETPQG